MTTPPKARVYRISREESVLAIKRDPEAVETARNGGDGHTFMVNVTTLESVNPIMFEKMPVDPGKELQHVALLANTQLFLVTRPS